MNPKENALRTIKFDHPERIVPGPPVHGVTYVGCNHEGFEGGGHHLPVGSNWTDIWGVGWRREHEGVMGFPRHHPLANLPAALRGFKAPSPDDARIVASIHKRAAGWERNEAFLSGQHRDTLWERSYMLVGMEDMMCFFHTEPEAARELLHLIMDFQLGIAKHYVEVGVEMVGLGDDLGTQTGLLLSPEIIREFLVPEYRRLIEFHKQRGALVCFHSCGHIEPVLEIFMELGVDVLNPIQATANDLGRVREATAGRMALQGGIASNLIMGGSRQEIQREARARMLQLGGGGGYFCGPDQCMPWPEENIGALRDAVEEFGVYPLSPLA